MTTTAVPVMEKVKYKKRALDLVNNLSLMNPKLKITKTDDEEHIYINGVNEDTSVSYQFKVPVGSFDFEGDEIAFHDFSHFYEFYSVLENAEITMDDEKFEMKSGKSKITFFLSDPEIVEETFDDVDFEDPDYKFNISSSQLKHIQKMVNLTGAEKLVLSVADETVTLKLAKEDKDNFYETDFETSESNGEEFSLSFKKTLWDHAPDGDYTVSVKEDSGVIQFSLQNETDVSLDLYSGEIEED